MAVGQINLENQFGEMSENYLLPLPSANDPVMVLPSTAAIYSAAGAPSFSAPAGSLYIRTDGTTGALVLYVNPTVGNHWIALITA